MINKKTYLISDGTGEDLEILEVEEDTNLIKYKENIHDFTNRLKSRIDELDVLIKRVNKMRGESND